MIAPTGNGTLKLNLATTGLVYSSLNITANPGVAIQSTINAGTKRSAKRKKEKEREKEGALVR